MHVAPLRNVTEYGDMAQLVAHLHGMQGVRGSSPLISTETSVEVPIARFVCIGRFCYL